VRRAGEEQMTKYKPTSGVLLFAASFFLYGLASPGNLPGDTELRWSVSRHFLRSGSFSLEDRVETRNYAIGKDGNRYAVSGLGQSLCLLTFAGIGLVFEKVTPINPGTLDLAAQFLASVILFPAIGAAGIWLFYRLVLSLGYSQKISLLVAAVLGFATMSFHYSVNTQEQTQEGLLLVLATLLMVKYYQQRRFVYAWLFCIVLGTCLLFRPASVVTVLPLYLIAAMAEILNSDKRNILKIIWKWLIAGILGTGGFIVICGWYNYIRFGSILESGYGLSTATSLGGHNLFESSPLPTLAAMLFSPGKSIFLYNPALLLFPLCVYSFYRRHKVVTLAASSAILSSFIFHSFFTAWAGDYAWSIRYQVPVLPFLVLPLVVLFSKPMKTAAKVFIAFLISISCVIQITSVVYNFNLEFVQNPNHHIITDNWVWDWSQSHLTKRFDNIGQQILGAQDFSSVNVANEEPLLLKYNHTEQDVRKAYVVNFFPFKARSFLHSEKLFYLLLCLWLILWVGFFIAVRKLLCLYRKLNSGKTPLPVAARITAQ
jgi:hypothetical protein